MGLNFQTKAEARESVKINLNTKDIVAVHIGIWFFLLCLFLRKKRDRNSIFKSARYLGIFGLWHFARKHFVKKKEKNDLSTNIKQKTMTL